MGIIKVDHSDPKLLEAPSYKVVPDGKHLFEVSNDLKIEPSKTVGSDNKVVGITLVCQDEGEYRGEKVFDNLVLGSTPEIRKKCDWKIAQFACACGVVDPNDLSGLDNLDLDEFKGRTCEAITKIETGTNPQNNKPTKRATVVQYLFEGQKQGE